MILIVSFEISALISPPSAVYLTALLTRFNIICSNTFGSIYQIPFPLQIIVKFLTSAATLDELSAYSTSSFTSVLTELILSAI